MRAVILMGHGGMDKLEYHTDWPVPTANDNEVLIRVGACGLNNTDVNTRSAWYSKGNTDGTTGDALDGAQSDDATWGGASISFPRIQGADVAGQVVAVGNDSNANLIGKRVLIDTWLRDWNDPLNLDACGYFGSECDGGYAEFTKVDVRHVHPIESAMTDVELASFATSFITAENMLERGQVAAGDSVMIPGASGGVGSALIQLAKRRGASVVAMCSASKFNAVMALGADAVIDRDTKNLSDALAAAVGRESVSVVADVVGGPKWPQLLDVIERGGRYTCAGAIAGPMVEFDLRTFYLRDLTFTGATVIPPDLFAKLVTYIEAGEVKPLVAAEYPLEQFHAAQQAFIAKQHVGNIVINMSESWPGTTPGTHIHANQIK